MLKTLNADQANFIALLAKSARAQRDALLGNVAETDLGGPTASRGAHNPAGELGFEPLSPDDSQAILLRNAVTALSDAARRELYALMRIGQGNLAAKKWQRGVTDAELLGDGTVTAAVLDDPDLHDHLTKGLYETRLAS